MSTRLRWKNNPIWPALLVAGTAATLIGTRAASVEPHEHSPTADEYLASAAVAPTVAQQQQAAGSSSDTSARCPIADASSLLPPSFRAYDTRRFTVFSDADSRWVQLQGERLERAAHQFERVMRRIGITPDQPRHNLVCILFDDHADYMHFASTYDNVHARWVSGYYSTKHDRIVFYNMESSPEIDDARQSIDAMKEHISVLNDALIRARRHGDRDRADALGRELAQQQDRVRSETHRVEKFTEDVIVATIIHEAIHQLAFHTGVQRPDVQYPIWINEGLATAFETRTPNHAFGPDHEYGPRREAFIKHLKHENLLPLREFVQLTSLRDATSEEVSVVYHQSYALVTWMMRARRSELRRYLELMQDAPTGSVDPVTHLEHFEQAFGNVDRLERAWLRHERSALR